MSNERAEMIALVNEACKSGAKQESACNTYQCWNAEPSKQDGRIEPTHSPKHKLTELERQRIINVANAPEYANLPPCQIVPRLADTGVYIASETSFYRVLNEHNQLKHRDKSKPARKVNKPRALTATAPNQIDTWDNRLTTLLATHPDVAPRNLELEVLETSALEDVQHVSTIMKPV